MDEATRSGEGREAYLERVVLGKLAAVAASSAARGASAILVADTVVLVDGAIFGKPTDDADARSMLSRLSGRAHDVCTRFAVASESGAALEAETVRTRVLFRGLSDDEMSRYVATGEGRDKAGAYAIQGIGAFAVARIEGSYSNVVGLPACEVVPRLSSRAAARRISSGSPPRG